MKKKLTVKIIDEKIKLIEKSARGMSEIDCWMEIRQFVIHGESWLWVYEMQLECVIECAINKDLIAELTDDEYMDFQGIGDFLFSIQEYMF